MGDQLFKFTGKFRCLEVKDLPQEFPIKNCSTDMKFLVDKTGEITAVTYLLSIKEIKNSVWQIGTGTLLIINNYILGFRYSRSFIFDTLYSLKNYIKSVYYNTYPLT